MQRSSLVCVCSFVYIAREQLSLFCTELLSQRCQITWNVSKCFVCVCSFVYMVIKSYVCCSCWESNSLTLCLLALPDRQHSEPQQQRCHTPTERGAQCVGRVATIGVTGVDATAIVHTVSLIPHIVTVVAQILGAAETLGTDAALETPHMLHTEGGAMDIGTILRLQIGLIEALKPFSTLEGIFSVAGIAYVTLNGSNARQQTQAEAEASEAEQRC